MRILMLGNSLTFAKHMPRTLAELTGAEVVHNTRGWARLAEHLDPASQLGARTRAALEEERWDYVVLQELSSGPVTDPKGFAETAARLCGQIREKGAVPVLYATWAYRDEGKLAELGLGAEEMFRRLYEAYHRAARDSGALVADVGLRFWELGDSPDLYAPDGFHPSEAGARLAAETIAAAILDHASGAAGTGG